VQRSDGGGEAEAEAASACVPAAVEAVERLRDELALAGRNARAVIADLRHDHISLLPRPNADVGAGSGVPESVLDQVGEKLGQQALVPVHAQAWGDLGGKLLRPLLGHWPVRFDQVGQQRGQVDGSERR
jgi:hypothetical protein